MLTAEPNGDGEKAKTGQYNLYGYDTVTGKTKFIATTTETIADNPVPSPSKGPERRWTPRTRIEEEDFGRKAQTTPDGRDLVFTSPAKLAAAEQAKAGGGRRKRSKIAGRLPL